MYYRHPEMHFKTPQASSRKSETETDVLLEGLQETHRVPRENLLETQEKQAKNAGGKEITFEVGDRVWHITRHFRTTRPWKKVRLHAHWTVYSE
jgi:hypothetical protein